MPVDGMIAGDLQLTQGALRAARSINTLSLTSGTGHQVSTTLDTTVFINTTTAGSAAIALSPDGTTYTTLLSQTTAATHSFCIPVPAGWYIKVTLTTSSFGTNHYY